MNQDDSPTEIVMEALGELHENPQSRVSALQGYRPEDATVERQASVFKTLANERRLQILAVLDDGECNVYELQACLELPQSTVANHLRRLRDAGLVKSRKKGKWTYYRVADVVVFELLDLAEFLYQ